MSELEYLELETKYNASIEILHPFKHFMKGQENMEFIYVESDDIYYTKGGEFLRYRFSDDKKNTRSELTFKKKLNDKDNIRRIEVNLRVDPNNVDTVRAFAEGLGYKRNFAIGKICHIYSNKTSNVVFYSVRDENEKLKHFIEIEVMEGIGLSEDEGWEIIRDWEKKLEPLGIKPQNRLKLSLFEMYRKEPC